MFRFFMRLTMLAMRLLVATIIVSFCLVTLGAILGTV